MTDTATPTPTGTVSDPKLKWRTAFVFLSVCFGLAAFLLGMAFFAHGVHECFGRYQDPTVGDWLGLVGGALLMGIPAGGGFAYLYWADSQDEEDEDD